MPRIRSQHPGQWTDEAFVACSPFARLLALAIRNEADDQGVFEWKPLQIKMRLFPGDNIEIGDLLEELVRYNHVLQFEHEGKQYAVIRNFRRFQRPKKPVEVYPLPKDLEAYAGLIEDRDVSLRRRKWEEQDGKCFYCTAEITHYSKKSNSLEIDHKTPISRGGTSGEDNLVATCRWCNRAKNDMNEDEYREWLRQQQASDAKNRIRTRKAELSPQMEEVGGRRVKSTESPNGDSSAPKGAPLPEIPEFLDRRTDLKAQVFGPCLRWLATRAGKDESKLRSLVGKWCKEHGDGLVIETFQRAATESPLEPIAWIEAALSKPRGKGPAKVYSLEELQACLNS